MDELLLIPAVVVVVLAIFLCGLGGGAKAK